MADQDEDIHDHPDNGQRPARSSAPAVETGTAPTRAQSVYGSSRNLSRQMTLSRPGIQPTLAFGIPSDPKTLGYYASSQPTRDFPGTTEPTYGLGASFVGQRNSTQLLIRVT
jgi:hypothetical protein